MISPEENEHPVEDIEEGEIADEGLNNDDDGENLPILQRKASLNDLAASRFWDDVGRREDTPRFVDQSQSGNQWRRDGLQYSSSSNGNYNPNLYNLAWVKAVQSKPSIPSDNNNNNAYKNSNAKSKDEKWKNSKGFFKLKVLGSENPIPSGRNLTCRTNYDHSDYFGSSSESGSTSSDDTDREIATRSKGNTESEVREVFGKVEVGGSCDNDENLEDSRADDDEKEEGELEEGEIEIESGSESLGSSLPSSPERFANNLVTEKGVDSRVDSDSTCGEDHGMNSRRLAAWNCVKQGSDEKKRLNDQEIEKRIADIAEILKNVTVKDAQKSFMSVCNQLQKAMECIIKMSAMVHASSVSGVVRQVFGGIQAAYAVYKTGSPRKQDQEKNAFPRLLAFVDTVGQKLFSSKQLKELQSMLQSVYSGARIEKVDMSQQEKLRGVDYTFKSEINERMSHNNETITDTYHSSKLIDSPYNMNEIRTFEPHEDTGMISKEIGSQAYGNTYFPAGGAESSDLLSFMPFEDPEDSDGSDLPTPTHEATPSCWNQQNLRDIFVESQLSSKPSIPISNSKHGESEESPFCPLEAVNAVTNYQEKFAGKKYFNSYDLPSPTPSEDNEENGTSDQQLEASTSGSDTWIQKLTGDREMRKTYINENVSMLRAKDSCTPLHVDVELQGAESGIQNCSSVKMEMLVSQSKYTATVETTKSLNLTSLQSRNPVSKIRDPRRRRLKESDVFTVDLNMQPGRVESNFVEKELVGGTLACRKHKDDDHLMQEPNYPKKQRHQSANCLFSKKFQVMISGSGGWLEESTVIPSSSDWDRPLEMEIDGAGALARSADLLVDMNSIFGADKEHSSTENGNLNKRQKTESFNQSNTSMAPASENGQSDNTDVNLNLKMISQGETERGEIIEAGSSDNTIAVNPTILMSRLKCGQESLSTHDMQKTEEFASSDPTGASMFTSGKEIAVNPSILKLSNLQQQVAQVLEPATNLTTQIANRGGESVKPRMKPRDPRRILPINSGTENSKLNGTAISCDPVNKEVCVTSSRPVTSDLVPKMPHVPSLPNIEQNFKEKLVSIAQMLGKSDMKTLQALSSQICAEQKRETGRLDLESMFGRSYMSHELNSKQGMTVAKDSIMASSSLQSSTDENTADAQNHPNPWGDLDHLLEGYSEEQRLAIHQERARRIEEQNNMFRAKKLCLVLDLDHTLLNSAKFGEVEPFHDEILRKKEEQDKERPQRQLFRFPHMGMWTKLRPGIWNFLDRASRLYELHVYTMGNKVYATEMAKVLDPTGTLFAGRVISKGDDADIDGDDRLPKSKDLDGVLGMESAVVIIDDSARVWPHHRHNLIVVERYMYFPCSRRQFGLPGPSLLEADLDERPEDGTLASSLSVIERLHHNFFSSKLLHQVDVRDILAEEQRKILMGCKVVFSRVFPVGEAQPHLHPLWQMAEQFGAVCSTQIDEQVTHVVAVAPGTDKVNWALAKGRFVVHPGWLEASALLYRRANERDYSIIMNHFSCPPH